MKRSTMTKLIEMQIKSDGLIQRSPVESTQRFAERVLQAVLKAGMLPPSHSFYFIDEDLAFGKLISPEVRNEFEPE
jgi:hypothetical protein